MVVITNKVIRNDAEEDVMSNDGEQRREIRNDVGQKK